MNVCGIAILGKIYLGCLYHSRLFSGLQIVKIWSISYALHFERVKIHKHCLYWSVFSNDINRKISFNCLLLYKLLLLSVSYMSQVIKLHIFVLTSSETEARFIFESYQNCHFGKVQSQLSSTFFQLSFVWSVKCSSHFLIRFFLVSKFYELDL